MMEEMMIVTMIAAVTPNSKRRIDKDFKLQQQQLQQQQQQQQYPHSSSSL
jgi:hypothetical protein